MRNILRNLILSTDSYKFSHYKQYPEGTTNVYSYIESRGSKISPVIMMFGLQYYLKEYLSTPVTMTDVEQAKVITDKHGVPFNYDGWKYIVEKHGGYLPLRIKAMPEGMVVETKNIMASVEATDPKCYWLVSYMETDLLRAVWYGSTVASLSYACKQMIYNALKLTADNADAEISFKLHDFGFRGVSSFESAAIGGAAHLVNFMGTDTMAGILMAMDYYHSDVCGYSIPAMEHSTTTSWGGREGEQKSFENMINHFAKEGALFACVSDSYDIYNATRKIWGENLLPIVKEKGATVVIRPDSGDPEKVPVEVIEILMEKVGYTVNSKGYKVLPNYVRVIQGDGININSIPKILNALIDKRISTSNIAFGMGGGLLQQVDRDTFKFAMKCSAIEVNGEWRDVYKEPVTDMGKISKKGRLALVKGDHGYQTVRENEADYSLLEVVYENGKLMRDMTFDEVRANSKKYSL
jgi:nicotinamide phosphoribosyltransferase